MIKILKESSVSKPSKRTIINYIKEMFEYVRNNKGWCTLDDVWNALYQDGVINENYDITELLLVIDDYAPSFCEMEKYNDKWYIKCKETLDNEEIESELDNI